MQSEVVQAARKLLQTIGIDLRSDWNVKHGANLLEQTNFRSRASNAWLSIGLPESQFAKTDSLDLFWCPVGIPTGTSLFVASSRLSRNLGKHSDWFDAFRTLCCSTPSSQQFIVSAEKTTAHRFLVRASQLFGFEILEFRESPKLIDLNWFSQTIHAPDRPSFPCYRIPLGEPQRISRDELLSKVASRVCVLAIRKGGRTESALIRRCHSMQHPNVSVLRSSDSSTSAISKLLSSGAHQWILCSPPLSERTPSRQESPRPRFRIPIVDQLPEGEFLIHCTRACPGPWPGQSEEEFLDDLIFQNEGKDHSATATLNRILTTGYLWANNQITRSNQRVVCFTEVPLESLHELRKFQSHLARWDFLPVGVAIRKACLAAAGARPVIYGDESTWSELSEQDQPYFQLATSQTKSGNTISWQLEREWRIIGDLQLNQFGEDDIFAFRINSSE